MSDTLVPEPQASIFDSVTKALGNDEDAAGVYLLEGTVTMTGQVLVLDGGRTLAL